HAQADSRSRGEGRRTSPARRRSTLGGVMRCRVTKLRVVSGLGVLLAASWVTGCATFRAGTVEHARAAEVARPDPPGPVAQAYYHYTVAQYFAQSGQFKDAVAALEEAIKLDPRSPFLWREQAQWLARIDNPEGAVAAARRAVELAPDDPTMHL